jgi:hypothetical protein
MTSHRNIPCSLLAAMLATSSGCAWIVGLDDHHLDTSPSDASVLDATEEDVSVDQDASDASHEDSSADAPGDQVQEEAADAHDASDAPDAPDGEAAASITKDFPIQADEDDGMWTQCSQALSDERLYYSSTEHTINVSQDQEDECAGLRFDLSEIPKGAHIVSATLTLTKVDAPLSDTDSIEVKVWDSANTPPFNDAHIEQAALHDPAGLWTGAAVQGWLPKTAAGQTTSPDLSTLVQHIVDLATWNDGGSHVALFLQRQAMVNTYVAFDDFSGMTPGVLHVTWQPQ